MCECGDERTGIGGLMPRHTKEWTVTSQQASRHIEVEDYENFRVRWAYRFTNLATITNLGKYAPP